jgi:ABC-type multidrug transport system ATPase subunit
MNQLVVRKLSKSYDKKTMALDSFSYEFTNGVYGLLGPNGAGKSTLMNLLTTNLEPTGGGIYFHDKNIWKLGDVYKKYIGYMPQSQKVYSGFTLERFLYYMAALKGIPKKEAQAQIPKRIKQVNLEAFQRQKLGQFSGGMKQRALLAQALLGEPNIIILDEPTAGLDPKERIRIRNLISEIAFDKIVIIATHVVPDVEFIAKNIIMLKEGKLLFSEEPYGLCRKMEGKVYEIECFEEQIAQISAKYKVSSMTKQKDVVKMRVIAEDAPEGFRWTVQTPDLEDVYLYYFDEE